LQTLEEVPFYRDPVKTFFAVLAPWREVLLPFKSFKLFKPFKTVETERSD